jgi:hypothetical protein
MQQPPLLPEETLLRVLRLARMDGLGALVLGTLFALVAAAGHHFPFTAVGLLGAGAGAIELHGVTLLRRAQPRGMNWLVASQPFLLVVIFSYCALRLWFEEMPPVPEQLRAFLAAGAAQVRMPVDDYLQLLNRIIYGSLAVTAVGFQGGMMIYYLRRRRAVRQALESADDATWP